MLSKNEPRSRASIALLLNDPEPYFTLYGNRTILHRNSVKIKVFVRFEFVLVNTNLFELEEITVNTRMNQTQVSLQCDIIIVVMLTKSCLRAVALHII